MPKGKGYGKMMVKGTKMKKTLLVALLISNGAIAQTTYLYGAQEKDGW